MKGKYVSYRRVVFDIETAPDKKAIERLLDPFNPDSVRLGNIKDVDKIAEKLKAAEKAHIANAYDKAALHAETAVVCAIGYKGWDTDADFYIVDADQKGEGNAIAEFWNIAETVLMEQSDLVGFNIKGFDLPFLIRRSYHLGLAVPLCVLEMARGRWHSCVLDLMEVYAAGVWKHMISLDRVCRSLRLGRKPDKVSGKEFWKWWRGCADTCEESRDQRLLAAAYLQGDLDMTNALADRLLGVHVNRVPGAEK